LQRVRILPAARSDPLEIGDFIALDNPERAATFVGEIEAAITTRQARWCMPAESEFVWTRQ